MDVWYQILLRIRILFDFIIDSIFACYYKPQKNRLPPITNEIVLKSASYLARKIKNEQLTAEEVVAAFIERAKEVNGLINAIVDDRFFEALKEARKIDADIQNGRITSEEFKRKPFLGVPFTTKESTASKGLRWTLGLVARKNIVADEDAEVVRLMKAAGAIQIAVTNIPQLNYWMESYNPLYGTCCNPYDLSRNAGGSSGGEGSIIAACGSPLGIGTDLGGSIRIPSHRCGIFGHKSSPKLISIKGLEFARENLPILSVVGPMVKHSEDLIPFYEVLLGDNATKLKLHQHVDLRKLNVFYMTSIKSLRNPQIKKEMQDNVLKVVEHFQDISERKPEELHFEEADFAVELWAYKIHLEKNDFHHDLTNRQGRVNVPLEYLKYLLGWRDYTVYTLLNMVGCLFPSVDHEWANETLNSFKKKILEKLGDNGVIIFPSESGPADFHYKGVFRPGMPYFCLWNALELPVTQVPLGLNKQGLPFGVQVATAPFQDHLSIAVACELEKAFGGYVKPGHKV